MNIEEKWQYIRLSDVISIHTDSFKNEKIHLNNSNIFIKPHHIEDGNISSHIDLRSSNLSTKNYKFWRVKGGELLISLRGSTLGNVAFYNSKEEALVHQLVGRIHINQPRLISQKYIYYILRSKNIREKLEKIHSYSARSVLRNSDLELIDIPLPNMSIQYEIESKMEMIEQIINKRKRSEELYHAYGRISFIELFGNPQLNPKNWPIVKLEDIVEINPAKRKIVGMDINIHNKVPFIGLKDVSNYGEILSLEKETTINDGMKGFYSCFSNNDVLLAKISPSFENGKGAVVKNLKTNFAFGSSEFFVLRPLEEALPHWLDCLLRFMYIRNLASYSMEGSSRMRLPVFFLKNLEIPLPPISLQGMFEESLQQINVIRQQQIESHQGLENLFNNYLANIFWNTVVRR